MIRAVFALVLVAALAAPAGAQPILGSPAFPSMPNYPQSMLEYWYAAHRVFVARAAQGNVKLLFIGDSITANWLTVGRAPWAADFVPLGAVNFAIGGDRTQNVLWRILDGELDGIAPRTIVLMIGANNLFDGAAAATDGISAVVRAVRAKQPQATIDLLGVLPVIGGVPGPYGEEVVAINAALAGLDDGTSVRFTNINAAFLNPDGTQKAGLFQPDGTHLTAAGYRVFADALRPILRRTNR
jgi:lysophospholipase L1-like esterase